MIMFHTNLRNLREMQGYSQKKFAELLKIPVTTYRNYENTLREPSYDILINIAKLLNVSTDELLGVKQTGDNYSQLFTLIKRLPESKLNTLCDFARFLSQ